MRRSSQQTQVPPWLGIFVVLGACVATILASLWFGYPLKTNRETSTPRTYGITWSPPYAEHLGVSSEEGLRAVLDDLHVGHVRLPVYWSRVEREQGVFDWSELDQHLDLLAAYHTPVTLAIGLKVPRWPECWIPAWATSFAAPEREEALRSYLRALITHTKQRQNIVAWQVENEPFFPFGICPSRTHRDVAQEIAFVRSLDPKTRGREIRSTDSGEVGLWQASASPLIDAVGYSIYRVTNASRIGMRTYDWLPPWWYLNKARITRLLPFGVPTYVSEFQMEPWVTEDIRTMTVEAMLQTFPLTRMQNNHWFLDHAAFSHVDFWGAEWWYWMKVSRAHPEFWDEARNIFQ